MGSDEPTPTLQYEHETGYLVLSDGTTRQIVCRPEGTTLWLWWKRGKREVPLLLSDLFKELERITPKPTRK